MLLLGLTGGIGSGKSTVSARLAERGAVIIDADLIAREVVEPGGAAYQAVIDRFGAGVVGADGSLDRAALADIVFQDAQALRDLEAITHPAVGQVMTERIAALAETDEVVVLDIPLLAEKGYRGVVATIVVDCPVETAVERLVAHRGFDARDARRRIEAQMSREERLALADRVIDNAGPPGALDAQIDGVWEWIEGLKAQGRPVG